MTMNGKLRKGLSQQNRRLIEEVVQLGAALHGKVDRSERFRILRTRLCRARVEDLRC